MNTKSAQPQLTPLGGTTLALGAYSCLSIQDALTKEVGQQLHVAQTGFFIAVPALVFILAAKPRQKSWRSLVHLERTVPVVGRAIAGLIGNALGIIAFTQLPLSEAYSLMFLAPLLSAILAAAILREQIAPVGWAAILIGFVGVIVVVRPGFAAVGLAHGAAIGVALTMAVGILLMRMIAVREDRTSVLFVLMAVLATVYGVACGVLGLFFLPTARQLVLLVAAGLFSASGQILVLRAASITPASRIAPFQYVQLIWATLLGAVVFSEQLDGLKVAGLLLVAVAGIMIMRRPKSTSHSHCVLKQQYLSHTLKGRLACILR